MRLHISILLVAAFSAVAQTSPPVQLGALAPANLAKARPKPAFDFTGTWQHGGGQNNDFRFSPPAGFKLTPRSSRLTTMPPGKRKQPGKVYRDDIGDCWPAGLPVIMTRVWPIAIVQLPTAIYMISGFMNSVRIIYMDGRKHTDPDVVVRSFNGESIGHWENERLVVDTRNFVDDHHWLDSGIPLTDAFRLIERMRLIDKGATLETEYTATDPKSWVGDWTWTKTLPADGRYRHHRGIVLARSQRALAQHEGGARRTLEETMKTLQTLCTLLVGLGVATSAYAHHSMNGFDRTKTITITGTVKQFKWANPHSWVEVEVINDKGVAELWDLSR